VAGDQGRSSNKLREMKFHDGRVDLRTFKMESESPRGTCWARLVAESRSFESSSRMPERNCWLVVHRMPMRAPQ